MDSEGGRVDLEDGNDMLEGIWRSGLPRGRGKWCGGPTSGFGVVLLHCYTPSLLLLLRLRQSHLVRVMRDVSGPARVRRVCYFSAGKLFCGKAYLEVLLLLLLLLV